MGQTQPETRKPAQSASPVWTLVEQGQTFCVRALAWDDHVRHAAYQALRYRIFYEQLRWDVSVTDDGREVDAYDEQADDAMHIHTVSWVTKQQEELVGGVRVVVLRCWQDSMVMREFRAAGLFPEGVLDTLQQCYRASQLLDITRLCVQRRCASLADTTWTQTHREIVQDLAIAGVYHVAEQGGRTLALAVVSAGYARLLQRAGFVMHLHYTSKLTQKTGYALIVIDLAASLHKMRLQGRETKVHRLLALCQTQCWLEGRNKETPLEGDQR